MKTALDKLKQLCGKHKYGDHQTLTAAILELSTRIEALEKPTLYQRKSLFSKPVQWNELTAEEKEMHDAPKPEDIEAAKSEAMAQSNFERKMRNNAPPLGVPDEDDLVFAWRSLEIPRPSHDLSHAIEVLSRAVWSKNGTHKDTKQLADAIIILEAHQKAGAK